MNLFLQELPRLQEAITKYLISQQGHSRLPVIEGHLQAIQRKSSFAAHHLCLLEGIVWSRMDGLGRQLPGSTAVDCLTITLRESVLELRHPTAVSDYAYLAMDGLTAAAVNMTDNFARVLNAAYGLGIYERRADLFKVRKKLNQTSVLAQLLNAPEHSSWLNCVSELRGRCQHADVDGVLINPSGSLAQRKEPQVPAVYCWGQSPADLPISIYAKSVLSAVELTLMTASKAVVADPLTVTSPR